MKIQLTIILFLLPILFNNAIPDYSGEWILDQSRSKFENVNAQKAAPNFISIRQTNDSIVIKRTIAAEQIRIETYSLDGKSIISKIDSITEKQSSCKWSDNGNELTIRSLYIVNNKVKWESSRMDNFSISMDRKILTLNRINIFPDHSENITAVYSRE